MVPVSLSPLPHAFVPASCQVPPNINPPIEGPDWSLPTGRVAGQTAGGVTEVLHMGPLTPWEMCH